MLMEKKGSHQKVEDLYNDVTQISMAIHAWYDRTNEKL